MPQTPKKGLDFTGVTVVFFCHDGNGNFLLAKRSQNARDEQGRWDTGGGGLEFGDSLEETLRREIGEEYGAEVLDFEFLGFREVHRTSVDDRPTHWIALDFKARVDPLKAKINEPHKFDRLGWFRLDNLPEPLHSQLPFAFARYKAKL
ncbi:MAG: NUDIX domain-containing protein [Patescibacteria group bacterium]|nr:NUDIX domain-containing protein [Patescibacteria group bacterium]